MKQTVNLKEINEVSVEIDIDEKATEEDIQYAAEMAIQEGNGNYGNTEYQLVDISDDSEFVDFFVFNQLRAAVQLLQYHANISTICAYIANFWQEGLITDSQEEILYNLADPESQLPRT